MQDDLLKKLIQEADARPQSAGGNPLELAALVRVVRGRRRRRRLTVIATAFVLLGCLLGWINAERHVPKAEKPSPEVAIATEIAPAHSERLLRARIEQIEREEGIVRKLLIAERACRLVEEAEKISARMTPPATRDEQVAPVAAGYLVSGDHKRSAGFPVASARDDYARVVELFPESIWADQAKARLASLKP
ncbi:MAG: hypothetical protein ACLP9L_35425 [Thermoguttaceae bacterium]